MTTTIDGVGRARQIRARAAEQVAALARAGGRVPGLATVLVGDDPASAVYVAAKRRAIREAGMRDVHHSLPGDATQRQVAGVLQDLAEDPDVTGILLQLPLPRHLSAAELIDLIPPRKDVDGLTTVSTGLLSRGEPGFHPCTPAGIVDLLESQGIEIKGSSAVVVGWSPLVGRPLAQLLLHRGATVTVAHEHTRDLVAVTRSADILVVATGVRGLIGAEHVSTGAVVVDVGIHRTSNGLHGDVRADELHGLARYITPVPGGVGPMTIAMLVANTVDAAREVDEQR